MKLFFVIFTIGITATTGYSQDLLNKVKTEAKKEESTVQAPANTAVQNNVAPASSKMAVPGNNGGLKDAIMAKLETALKLTDAQKTSVGNTVDGYLNKKANMRQQAATSQVTEKKQSAALNTDFLSKIKSEVSKEQYSKFLKLKPKTASNANPLSALFN